MTYRLYFEYENKIRDYMDISGDTLEEVRKNAYAELKKRNADGLWSERIK